jgi:uncharacterized protein (DUF1501 family)
MKRRSFKKQVLASILSFEWNSVMASASIESNALDVLANAAVNCGKILVIIQNEWGNDGLNTVFPLDKWTNLNNARSNILMNQSSVLPLANNNATTGLHPANV